MKRLRALFQRFRTELLLYRRILADPRTPRSAKFLLGLAVAYTVTPLDLIPELFRRDPVLFCKRSDLFAALLAERLCFSDMPSKLS